MYTENSILLPIFSSETNLLAILELSDSQNNFEDIDEQYFIRLVAEFLPKVFQRIIEKDRFKYEIHYNDMVLDIYNKLFNSDDLETFLTRAFEILRDMFFVSDARVYALASQEEVLTYAPVFSAGSDGKVESYTRKQIKYLDSLAAKSVDTGKSCIETSVQSSKYFNSLIDIETTKPLFIIPIIRKFGPKKVGELTTPREVMGVVEIALAQKPLRITPQLMEQDCDHMYCDDGVEINKEYILKKIVDILSAVMQKCFLKDIHVKKLDG